MKLALITDTHFGGRSDSLEFDSFFKKFYDEIFFPELDKRGIKRIMHLGDCFDRRKYINFNSLQSCKQYFFDAAKDRGIEIDMIVGNHDTFYKNTNELNSPELLLKQYSNIRTYSTPTDINVDGRDILMLPWICTGNLQESLDAVKETKAKVCFAHLELAGFLVFKNQDAHDGFDPAIFKHFDLVCTGHFHHRHSKNNIVYLGNPYELFWNDVDDPRGFHVFDTDSLELEFVENTNTIFYRHYYDDSKDEEVDFTKFAGKSVKLVVVNKKDFYKFDLFLDKLYKQNPIELKIIEDMSEYEADNIDTEEINVEDTITLLSHYVDSIDLDTNKEKLKTIMKTLYVEAQNLD